MLIHVPKFFPAAARIKMPQFWKRKGCLDPGGDILTAHFYGDLGFIYTNKVSWHTDGSFPPYSALVVVRNTGIAVQAWGKPSVEPENGDLVILNIHKNHRATQTKPDGRLLCLVTDYHTQPSLEQVLADYKNTFKKYREQVPRETEY